MDPSHATRYFTMNHTARTNTRDMTQTVLSLRILLFAKLLTKSVTGLAAPPIHSAIPHICGFREKVAIVLKIRAKKRIQK